MTTFTINDQFDGLVKVTLSEQQTLTGNSDSIQQEMTDGSAKSQDFFQNNKSSERKYTTTRIKSKNFYLIFHMLELTKKISTMNILFSMSICWLQNI